MANLTIIDISWSERSKVVYSRAQGIYVLPDDDNLSTQGFYCIYGRHPVYGPDVLLYIGETKATASGSRSFDVRLREHTAGRFWYHANLSYSLGISEKPLDTLETRLAESILIAAHKPALNRRSIDRALPGSEKYLIRNWDFPASLQHECSGEYWRQ